MADQGPSSVKTYNRPADRWPDDQASASAGLRKFVAILYSDRWMVHHALASTNLILDVWVDSSTPNARYQDIVQVTNNDMVIQWDRPARGKIVIYSLRDTDDSSRVLRQETASTVWDLPHDLGTSNLLVDFWIDNKRVDPILITLTDDAIHAEFSVACTGKACVTIADPSVNSELRIRLAQIVDWPTAFPPSSHSHNATTILGSQDSSRLNGQLPTYYLNVEQLGDTVCPLTASDHKIPVLHIPDEVPIKIMDSNGAMIAYRLRLPDTTSPLYLQRETATQTGIIAIKPVCRYINLSGNIRPGIVGNRLEPDLDFSLDIEAGAGVRVDVLSGKKIRIVAPVNAPQLFHYTGILPDLAQWVIEDGYFGDPGRHLFYLYETLPDGGQGVLPICGPWFVNGMKMETFPNKVVVENAMGRSVENLTLVAMGESVV